MVGLFGWVDARKRKNRPAQSASRRLQLLIEALEDRCVPAGFEVTDTSDLPVAGTLRQAILDANANPGPDEITFQAGLTGPIVLTEGEIAITGDLTISGPGANNLTVSGNNQSRIFRIGDDDENQLTVAISGLTLTEGDTSSEGGDGGAIFIENENVTINHSVITGNRAGGNGGGISIGYGYCGCGGYGYEGGGTLTVRNSTISGNIALGGEVGDGGGITAGNDTSLTIEDSTISGNVASNGNGGGIVLFGDTALAIRRSIISGNTATDVGGGIAWYAASGTGTNLIEDSTISGNTAGAGGGVFLYGAYSDNTPVTIRNTTISGNFALDGRFGGGYGGGLFLYDGDTTELSYAGSIDLKLQNTTIASNFASFAGGGIAMIFGEMTLQSTIVADNSASEGNDIYQPEGETFLAEFSLIEDPNGGTISDLTPGSNILGLDPLLGNLANNGGPTQTHALTSGSPALDVGSNPAGLSFDQRGSGFPRVIGSQIDIGAFEGGLRATLVDSLATDANLNGVANPGDVIQYAATLINTSGADLGSLSFTTTFIDPNTTEDPNSIRITPIAFDDTYTLFPGATFEADFANGLLSNDDDPDGLLTGVTVTSWSRVGGTITGSLEEVNPDGSFTYKAPNAFGFERFQYSIADAQGLPNVVAGFIEFRTNESFQSLPAAPTLTQGELDGIVSAARQRWISVNLTAGQYAALYQAQFVVADLSSGDLANVVAGHAMIDSDAAGLGWYVDVTPLSDEEYTTVLSATRRAADGVSVIAGQFDLLTVVMNHMGRLMNIDSTAAPDLMSTPIAGVRHLPAGENLAPALNALFATYGFRFKDSYYQNWLGHNEKWLQDRTGAWHFVTANGNVYRWNGIANNNLGDDTLVAGNLNGVVHADPTRLFHAPAQLSAGTLQQLTQLQQTYGFRFSGSYWENWLGEGEKWFLDRASNWFYIKADGGLFTGAGASLGSLDTDVHADPTALFRAVAALPAASARTLAELQSRHGFHFAGSYHENWLNRGEKWFQDRASQWYFITGNGQVWRWGHGTGPDTLIGQLDSQVHANPNLLLLVPTALTVFQSAAPLTHAQLASMVSAAQQRWIATGLSGAQLTALQSLTFEVANFSGAQLGSFSSNHLRIDVNGGGHGWFVDASPLDDVEFADMVAPTRRLADPLSAPAGHVDLLTTVLHEMGHALGLADTYALATQGNLMFGYLGVGERRLPAATQALGAVPGTIPTEEFLSTITINTLPNTKGITVYYQARVNNPLPAGVTEVCSQGTFNALIKSGEVSVVTDDPATAEENDQTCTVVAANGGGRSLWLPFG